MAPRFYQDAEGWNHPVSRPAVSARKLTLHATLVLRPQDNLKLVGMDPSKLHAALSLAAKLSASEAPCFMVRIDDAKNLAFLLCKDAATTEKLRPVPAVTIDQRQHRLSIYQAAAQNSCKGVMHNIATGTNPETLMQNLSALDRDLTILAARMMGRTATAIITFAGTHVPREVCYAGGLFRCRPHLPEAQFCSRCQLIGHRVDVCTRTPRCPKCGKEHEDGEAHECDGETVCFRCGGQQRADNTSCSDR